MSAEVFQNKVIHTRTDRARFSAVSLVLFWQVKEVVLTLAKPHPMDLTVNNIGNTLAQYGLVWEVFTTVLNTT